MSIYNIYLNVIKYSRCECAHAPNAFLSSERKLLFLNFQRARYGASFPRSHLFAPSFDFRVQLPAHPSGNMHVGHLKSGFVDGFSSVFSILRIVMFDLAGISAVDAIETMH